MPEGTPARLRGHASVYGRCARPLFAFGAMDDWREQEEFFGVSQESDGELLFKARPATEGDDRFVYCEPTNPNRDIQREVVERDAVAKAAGDYLKFGNIDIDHLTMIGPRLGMTPEQAKLYEIGLPVDVTVTPAGLVFVKAQIYRGDHKGVEQANFFWDSITNQIPARRWYPSIGGRTIQKTCDASGCAIKALAWTNTAFAKEPVNHTVKAVSLMPFDVFAKALTAGYGTDSATLTGGAALRRESLAPTVAHNNGPAYEYARRRYEENLKRGAGCEHTSSRPTLASIVAHFRDCEGCDPGTAKAYAARLLRDAAQRRNAKQPAALAA